MPVTAQPKPALRRQLPTVASVRSTGRQEQQQHWAVPKSQAGLILFLAPQHGRQNRDRFALRGASCRNGFWMEAHNHLSFSITPMAGSIPISCCKNLQVDTGETPSYKIHFLPLYPTASADVHCLSDRKRGLIRRAKIPLLSSPRAQGMVPAGQPLLHSGCSWLGASLTLVWRLLCCSPGPLRALLHQAGERKPPDLRNKDHTKPSSTQKVILHAEGSITQ